MRFYIRSRILFSLRLTPRDYPRWEVASVLLSLPLPLFKFDRRESLHRADASPSEGARASVARDLGIGRDRGYL